MENPLDRFKAMNAFRSPIDEHLNKIQPLMEAIERANIDNKPFNPTFNLLEKYNSIYGNYSIEQLLEFGERATKYNNEYILKLFTNFKTAKDSPLTKEYLKLYKNEYSKVDESQKFFESEIDLYPNLNEKEEEEKSSIITLTNRIKLLIAEVYENNNKIFSIDPRDFERMVKEILQNDGFKVDITKQTRDGGYDLVAMRHESKFGEQKFLVECKRWSQERHVGVDVLRSLMYVVGEQFANKGMIVTSSYFSGDIKKMQEAKPHLITLADNGELMKWIRQYLNK